ncbi:MAG: sucrose phosphate phosphatase [Trebouxia sp. A1-2]|nr:MAG: sucrose phosphate phosphatase [Trebouxia sp. A1-2]
MAASVLNKQYRFILVSDLDWTMVDHDDKENTSLHAFNKLWQSEFAQDCLLVFSTGRSLKLYNELRDEVPLGVPDVLICSVGTEIFFEKPGSDGAEPQPDKKWTQLLDQGWNRKAALEAAAQLSELKPQSESEQRPHKLSYIVSVKGDAAEKVVSQLEDKLQAAGVTAKVIYSGGADLDILPQHASKGKGLEFLLGEVRELVGAPKDGVLVNGDSGNDIELFAVPGVRGCMVVNAHPELKKWCDAHPSPNLFQASKRCAGGIVEALQHFKLAKHT